MQLAGPNSPLSDPDPLPSPPFFAHYLLENPWPAVVILILIATLVFYTLARRNRTRQGLIVAAAAALLAAGVWFLARSVETTREHLIARSDALIRAGIAADAPAVAAALRSDVTLTLLGRRTNRDKAYLVALAQRDIVAQHNAKDTRIKWTTAALDGPNLARTQTRVIVNRPDFPTHTTWLLTWAQDADGTWRVRSVEAQQIGFMSQGSVGDP